MSCGGGAFIVGQGLRIEATFRDLAGRATDPDTVTLRITDPAQVTTTYVYGTDVELVRLMEGVFYLDLSIALEGCYTYAWTTTGDVQAVADGRFEARAALT